MANQRRKGLKLVGAYVDKRLHAEIASVGRRYGRTLADVVRDALELWLREQRTRVKAAKPAGK